MPQKRTRSRTRSRNNTQSTKRIKSNNCPVPTAEERHKFMVAVKELENDPVFNAGLMNMETLRIKMAI